MKRGRSFSGSHLPCPQQEAIDGNLHFLHTHGGVSGRLLSLDLIAHLGMGDAIIVRLSYFSSSDYVKYKQSEDCLYLNVYRPLNANATSKLPVLHFLYGGS